MKSESRLSDCSRPKEPRGIWVEWRMLPLGNAKAPFLCPLGCCICYLQRNKHEQITKAHGASSKPTLEDSDWDPNFCAGDGPRGPCHGQCSFCKYSP
jgi:hypothetical protein